MRLAGPTQHVITVNDFLSCILVGYVGRIHLTTSACTVTLVFRSEVYHHIGTMLALD